MLNQLRELRLDVLHECGAAGAGQQTLLGKLLCLCHSHHICAQRSLDDVVEAKSFQARDDLTKLCVGELRRDRGSDDGIYLIVTAAGVSLALLEDIDGVNDIRFVRDRAKRALIYARTALDALGVIDLRSLVLVHRDCLDLTSILAGTLTADDGSKGTYLCARAAFLTLALIDMCHVVAVKGQSAKLTNVLAAVCKTAAAGVGDLVAAYGTLIAGDIDDLDDVGVFLIAAHCELNALTKNCALLVYAAAHCGLLTGSQLFGNIYHILQKLIFPRQACNLTQDLVFQMLYFCIKFTHFYLLRNS